MTAHHAARTLADTAAHILLVEDSPTQLQQLEFVLEEEGYRVMTAGNGAEALALAEAHEFDLVITDLIMPVMDGIALCRRLRASEKLRHLPVMLLTALNAPEQVLRGIECGANGFISKPCDDAFLLAQLRQALATRPAEGPAQADDWRRFVFAGKQYLIEAQPRQVVELLLSTYASALHQNEELKRVRDELREANDKLLRLATEDPLTGIANRLKCSDLLAHHIEQVKRYGNIAALLYFDLDGFKPINDRWGHEAGDLVLREVAHRMVACTRAPDVVARIGGDEFAVILTRIKSEVEAGIVAQRMIEALGRPINFREHQVTVGASVGIGLLPADGLTVHELFKRADTAMYAAKKAGKNAFRFYRDVR